MAQNKSKRTSRSKVREEQLAAASAVVVEAEYDVVVVGGGAAGLTASICAAEAGASVLVLERDLECGRSILATGNGRCNFSNEHLDATHYNDPVFVRAVCGDAECFLADVLEFFRACGMAWTSEEGRLYPLSRQAASVRRVLLDRSVHAGVVLAPLRGVTGLVREGDGWRVMLKELFGSLSAKSVFCRSVIIACGGSSKLVEGLELDVAPWEPVLCPLSCENPWSGIDGRRAHVVARLFRNGVELAHEQGEVLFRREGLSGIVMFDFSRLACPGDEIELDLACGQDVEGLRPYGWLDPVIADALGQFVCSRARRLRFDVRGIMDPERAQVSRGGILTSQLDPATLGVCAIPGLFAAGEAVNIDGDCGGFNLSWAWKSGMVAGAAAAARY